MLRIALACSLAALASGPPPAHAKHVQPADHSEGEYAKASPTDTALQDDAVVVIAPTLGAWSAKLSKALGEAMRFPRIYPNERPADGLALVGFDCSEAGTPTGMTLVQSSGNRRIDKAAMDTIRRIKTLHPLAAGIRHDQSYVAALVFADSEESREHHMRTLRKWSATRTAQGSGRERGSGREIALLISSGDAAN